VPVKPKMCASSRTATQDLWQQQAMALR